jgi:signal transduction histidine kinase
MPLVTTEHDPTSRQRVTRVYLQNGVVGAVILLMVTWLRRDEPRAVLERYGAEGVALVALFLLFATLLAMFKFPLTEKIFVSLVIIANIAMFPLLGLVLSAWIAVAAAVTQRVIAARRAGRARNEVTDRTEERARTLALFATYGVPVVAATLLYEILGGEIGLVAPSLINGARIAFCAVVMIVTNNLIVARVEQAYGYSPSVSLKLGLIDTSIYLVTLPYAVLTTFSYSTMGMGGLLLAAFTGLVANAVGYKLAITRSDREQLIQRLASLTNIGRTISLRCTTDELLRAIYEECRKVIDVSIFSIALHDMTRNELSFELNIERGTLLPKSRIPIGDGLNSFVVTSGEPLLVGSYRDEQKLGLTHYDDGMATESWLGVPMTARDETIGVISVQSFDENAFSPDDVVLLTAIANQAAVAIENANLYKDLQGMNRQLEQRVLERTNEVRETNIRLIAADRSKNQFLANMSHELRTPLNAIIGFSGILQQATREMIPARLHRFIDNIATAGSHLLDLINDILDLAKIESGKLQLHSETFDLRETIATVERVMKGIGAETNVSIMTQVDPTLTSVHLDEGRLKQILLNLLSNAVKFSHPGGYVYLSVSAVNETTSLLGCPALRIEVQDNGIGIPEDELDHVFDEFYQATQHDRRLQKSGTGLGLSLAKSFVEMHRGHISVQSTFGAGTRFTIELPRDIRQATNVATRIQLSLPETSQIQH